MLWCDLAAYVNKMDAEYTLHMGVEEEKETPTGLEPEESTTASQSPDDDAEPVAPPAGSLRTRRLSSLKDNIFCVAPFILHDSVDEMSVEFTFEGIIHGRMITVNAAFMR